LQKVNEYDCGGAIQAICAAEEKAIVAIVTCSADAARVEMFTCKDGALQQQGSIDIKEWRPDHVVLSKSAKKMALAGRGARGIQLWSVEEKHRLATLGGHRVGTTAVDFSPDERLLASTGQDSAVKVWDVATGALVGEWYPFSNGVGEDVAFAPDGDHLLAAGGYEPGEVVVWQVKRRPGGSTSD
jgi:WD40 repeat protein